MTPPTGPLSQAEQEGDSAVTPKPDSPTIQAPGSPRAETKRAEGLRAPVDREPPTEPMRRESPGEGNQMASAEERARRRQRLLTYAAQGLILATLSWYAALRLGLTELVTVEVEEHQAILIVAPLGALVMLTRLRWLLWALAGGVVLVLLLVAFTPIMGPPMRALVRSDPLERSDVIIVLAGGVSQDGTLSGSSQDRLLRGIELARQGLAPRLVTSYMARVGLRSLQMARDQIAALGLTVPIEAVGPVVNTHDEAVAIARLARERGWRRAILVTSPSHTRRARACFHKAGLPVRVHPCLERLYNPYNLVTPRDRIDAFYDWLHEWVGLRVYRWRGWI